MIKTGVYKITYLRDPSIFYVGSAATSLDARKREHISLLNRNKHHSKYLQRLWNKYGQESFKFEIITLCLPYDCIKYEQYWIDKSKPILNTCKIAGSTLGIKHTKESKEKLKKAWQSRKQISCQTSNVKIIRSDGLIFNSLREASKYTNISPSNIIKCCKDGKYRSKGYYFQYFDNFIDWDCFIKKITMSYTKKIKCNETGQEFNSIMDAARFFNLKEGGNISAHLKGRVKKIKGYTFSYIGKEE